MDGEAVRSSTDDMLKSFGLHALGDRIALRTFVKDVKTVKNPSELKLALLHSV